MGAGETNLSNARAFLVNHTRQQMDVRLFTDDKAKLIRQLESNRGDKTSALEAIGELAVERILSGKDGSRDAAIGEDARKPSLDKLERKHSEEHTSEPPSIIHKSYAGFRLKN